MEPWAFVALGVGEPPTLVPQPASPRRTWMEATPDRFARRCLPLVMANQAGWTIPLPWGFRATWDGRPEPGGIQIEATGDALPPGVVADHFGSGIVTFHVPHVFRTAPGVQLSVRGAPNFWVDGAHALEGIVETDWASASFTMNWRLLTPGRPVVFRQGDPICFLQPISLELIEAAVPSTELLEGRPEDAGRYEVWSAGRATFNADRSRPASAWQKDYFVGRHATGELAPHHRTVLHLSSFADDRGPTPAGAADRCFAPVAGLAFGLPGPEDEECVVTDAQGRSYALNRSAAFVLSCCTGQTTAHDIAIVVQAYFGTDEPPAELVVEHLESLAEQHLVVEVTA